MPEVQCSACSGTVYRRVGRASVSGRYFCSKLCHNAWRRAETRQIKINVQVPAKEAAQLRAEGWSFARIAAHYGVSRDRVRKQLVRLGLHVQTVRSRPRPGGGWTAPDGYKHRYSRGRDRDEHRLTVEKALGRMLLPDEAVHHINHNKLDNRIENLRVMTHSEHIRLHWEERRADRKARKAGFLFA